MNIKVNDNYDKGGVLRSILKNLGIQNIIDDKFNNGVTDIAINRPFEIWFENSEGWHLIEAPELTLDRLMKFANTFAIFNSNSIDFQNPICSGVLPDGERAQVMIPPSVEDNTVSISIRIPSSKRFSLVEYKQSNRLSNYKDNSRKVIDNSVSKLSDLDKLQSFERELLEYLDKKDITNFLELAVKNKLNIVLVGGTGSGKTTFTKAVVDCISKETRLMTIEDTPELDLPNHPNHVRLFYGRSGVTPRDLVKSCMRMKPDRVLLTELRGDEAWEYLSLLNTGHAGSVTTVHANDCEAAYFRIGSLIKQSEIGKTLDHSFIMKEVFTTLDIMMFFEKTHLKEISYNPIRKYKLLNGVNYE